MDNVNNIGSNNLIKLKLNNLHKTEEVQQPQPEEAHT